MPGTRYRYYTADGAPPNDGAPPGASSQSFPLPGMFPMFGGPPPYAPSPVCYGTAPASAPKAYVCHPVSTPSCPSSRTCHCRSHGPPSIYPGVHVCSQEPSSCSPVFIGSGSATAQPTLAGCTSANPPPYDDAPPPGGRVKGLLPKFPNGDTGYIFPKSNCTFHLVKGKQKPWEWRGLTLDFQVMHAPTNMTVAEFIEQIGAINKAPVGTPRNQIGVTEILEAGSGLWHKGTTFLLGDGRSCQTLADVGWDNDRGEAGRSKPVHLIMEP